MSLGELLHEAPGVLGLLLVAPLEGDDLAGGALVALCAPHRRARVRGRAPELGEDARLARSGPGLLGLRALGVDATAACGDLLDGVLDADARLLGRLLPVEELNGLLLRDLADEVGLGRVLDAAGQARRGARPRVDREHRHRPRLRLHRQLFRDFLPVLAVLQQILFINTAELQWNLKHLIKFQG